MALTVTDTVAGELAHPLSAITVYVPVAAVVTFVMKGFCDVDVNPFGPVQLKVAPGIFPAVSNNVDPEHTGVFDDAVGVAGALFTVTVVDPAGPVHPFTVAVTEYVPVSAVVADGIVGFCADDVNPFGPVQL